MQEEKVHRGIWFLFVFLFLRPTTKFVFHSDESNPAEVNSTFV